MSTRIFRNRDFSGSKRGARAERYLGLAALGLARNSKRREICAAEVSTYDRLRRNDSHDLKIAQNIEEKRRNTTALTYRGQSKPIVGLRIVAQKLPGTLGRALPKCDRSRPSRPLQFLSKRGTRKESDLACRFARRRPTLVRT